MFAWFLAAHHQNLTIVLSSVAVGISLVALGWNVYRDIILKPRCQVRFRIAQRPNPTGSEESPRPWWSLNSKKAWVPYLELTVVNFGPGLLVVSAAVMRTQSAVESLWAEHLGTELEKGQKVSIGIPNLTECCLDKNPLRIGIRDSFGRVRWAPRKDLKRVQKEYALEKQKASGPSARPAGSPQSPKPPGK